MTDAQLALLLKLMVSELVSVIEDVRQQMPEDAPREGRWVKKPGYEGPFILYLSEDNHDWVIDGDYIAVRSLESLAKQWQERIQALGGIQEN